MTTTTIQKGLKRLADAHVNIITKLGLGADKSNGSRFRRRRRMTNEHLSALYEQDPLHARHVDRIVDDAIREGFTIEESNVPGYDWSGVMSDLEDLQALRQLGDAWRWSRLWGGSIAIPVLKDGAMMAKPPDLSKVRSIRSVNVIPSPWAEPIGQIPGMGSSGFGQPEQYRITLPFQTQNPTRLVSSLRVVRFDGVQLSPLEMAKADNWGPSVCERVRDSFAQLAEAEGYARNVMHEISSVSLSMRGYRKMLLGSCEDQENLKKILEMLKWERDNLHMTVHDEGDEFQENTRSVAGLAVLMDKFRDTAVRSVPEPRTIILGEQPGGLGSDASSEIRAWYDFVHSQQPTYLTPGLNKLIEILLAIRRNREPGIELPTKWTIRYNELWQPSDLERAQARLTNAQARAADGLILSAPEIRTDSTLQASYDADVTEAPEGAEPVTTSQPGQPQQAPTEDEPEAGVIVDPKPEILPSDLRTTAQLGEVLGRGAGSVKSLAKSLGVQVFKIGGGNRISEGALMRAIAEANGVSGDGDGDGDGDGA